MEKEEKFVFYPQSNVKKLISNNVIFLLIIIIRKSKFKVHIRNAPFPSNTEYSFNHCLPFFFAYSFNIRLNMI